MARPRKKWKTSTGRYGSTITLREPRLGAALRWDYRHEGQRCREEVYPPAYVRRSPDEPVDPVLVRHAENLCELKAAELKLAPVRRREVNAHELTVGEAYALYFDPRREALPTSRSGLTHQKGSRDFWQTELGPETLWNSVAPADAWGSLMRLRQKGQVATATKRLQNLRTLTRWLQQRMRIRGLEDPTLGLDVKELREGYRERRPRLTREQKADMKRELPAMPWRTRLFFSLLLDSGTRGGQARTAMRSGLDAPLEPLPPRGVAPFGWMLFGGVKGQRPHLTYLTLLQRLEIVRAISKYWDGAQWVDGPLAEWERAYQAGEMADYPLLPSGRTDRGELAPTPISDKALRNQFKGLLAAAGIEAVDRLGFHAARRAWADLMNESEGLETATAAGGWHDPRTVEGTYLSEYRHELLERARKRMEGDE